MQPNFEGPCPKIKIFRIWTFWGPATQKGGPKTKIFQQMCKLGPNMYVLPNFGKPSLDNKEFKILTFWGLGLKIRAPNQNFSTDMKSETQNLCNHKF